MPIIVAIKLIAPSRLLTPDRCKLTIALSTAMLLCELAKLNVGYSVQPTPAPDSISKLSISNKLLGIRSQKLTLFSLGIDISTLPSCSGTK